MRLEARKYLYDIKQAADLLAEFADSKQFTDYQDNAMLRAAAERKFEIIGEALSKLSKGDLATVSRTSEHARIIAFRNTLIHGYAERAISLRGLCVEQSCIVVSSTENHATEAPARVE